jgi:hypothetical protein
LSTNPKTTARRLQKRNHRLNPEKKWLNMPVGAFENLFMDLNSFFKAGIANAPLAECGEHALTAFPLL